MKFSPLFNVFCEDIDKQLAFYRSVLGWHEIQEASSKIYRVLECGGVQIGFNAWKAYDLLGLGQRKRPSRPDFPLATMLSFVVQSPLIVEQIGELVPTLGGRVVQGPFATYYGHWQIVLCDPEGNVARITCPTLPAGMGVPIVDLS